MPDFLSGVFTWSNFISNLIWSIPITIGFRLVLWLFQKPVREKYFWVIVPLFVITLLFAASYLTGGRSRLNEPHISGTIEGVNMAPVPGSNNTSLLVIATIYNSGAPSFTDNYRLRVRIPGIPEEIVGAPQILPESMTLINEDGSSAVYYGQDALYNKTTAAPIPTGGMVRGILWFVVPSVNRDTVFQPETTFILSFTDALHEEHIIESKAGGVAGEAPKYIPGLRPPAPPSPSPSPSSSPTPKGKRTRRAIVVRQAREITTLFRFTQIG